MTICPICQKDLPDEAGLLRDVLALPDHESVLLDALAHADARQVLRSPWSTGAEVAAARIVLGLDQVHVPA